MPLKPPTIKLIRCSFTCLLLVFSNDFYSNDGWLKPRSVDYGIAQPFRLPEKR
jgi:hypothetical protein